MSSAVQVKLLSTTSKSISTRQIATTSIPNQKQRYSSFHLYLNTSENKLKDLSDRGHKKFDADIRKFEKNQEKSSVYDQRLLTLIKSTATEQSRRAIRNDPR